MEGEFAVSKQTELGIDDTEWILINVIMLCVCHVTKETRILLAWQILGIYDPKKTRYGPLQRTYSFHF